MHPNMAVWLLFGAAVLTLICTSPALDEKDRRALHSRATAVTLAIMFGYFLARVLVWVHAKHFGATEDYTWQFGLAFGVVIYFLTMRSERKSGRFPPDKNLV